MNNYHLYEEIGHGKYSTVYKGRKRYTIQYVAIKSIEKNKREKVMTEVGILSNLQHQNIVGFVNWYETRNHLWIIFEYCAGGDLLRLLKQDGCLPEDQVRHFGRDICAGLLHCHGSGVIYSDLKPANILCTEANELKLCDFGHSQRLDAIEHSVQERTPLPRRGTPHYMAPELFLDGGMHSFASDLWSLGCVFHELLTGRPPFHSSSFAQLQQMVQSEVPAPAQGGSPEFLAVVQQLLKKNLFERLAWPELQVHTFWQGSPPVSEQEVQALPEEAHLEALRRLRLPRETSLGEETRQPAYPSGPPVTPTKQITKSFSTPQDKRPGFELLDQEAESAEQPRRNSAAAQAAAAAAAAALAAQTTAQVATAQPAAPATSQAGSLRARFGAALFARVRELSTVSEPGVRPISRNPQIEEPEDLEMPSDLPFTPMRLEDVCTRPHAELEVFLTKVYRCIAQGSPEQKISTLKYLELICCHMQVADLVVNSSLLKLVVRILHARRAGSTVAAATPGLRARLLSLIGQLLRHACYLEPGEAEHALFDVLLEGLRDTEVLLRRRAAAALGELLFYVATQPSPSGAGPLSPGAAVPSSQGSWQVPNTVLHDLVQALMSSREDPIVQHYVVKTVENVATQSPNIAYRWFYSPEFLWAMSHHARSSRCEHFRQSCLAAAAHLWRGMPEEQTVPTEADKNLTRAEPELVVIGLNDLAPQGVPHALQLCAQVLLRSTRLPTGPGVPPLLPSRLVDELLAVASQARHSAAVRGRALVILGMFCALDDPRDAHHLRSALEQQLPVQLERLAREEDGYLVQCVTAVTSILEATVVSILQSLVDGIRRLSAENGAASTMRGTPDELAAGPVYLLPVFVHIACSSLLSSCIFGPKALPLLGAAFDLAARTPGSSAKAAGSLAQGGNSEQLQPLVLMVMEALTAQQGLMLEHAPQVIRCLLPALAAFLPSSRGEIRLLAMKCFCGINVLFLNDDHIFAPLAEKPTETTLLLEALLCGKALPALPVLLTDQPPAPSYALRLLATLLSRGSSAAGMTMREVGLARHILASLRNQQGLAPHTALLTHCLLQARQVSVKDLAEAGILDAVCKVLAESADVVKDPAGQLDFAMVDGALNVAEEGLAQLATAMRSGGGASGKIAAAWDPRHPAPPELGGCLAQAMPQLAVLCAPLARAKLTSLLERATSCCQHAADIARCCTQEQCQALAELPAKSVAALLETLTAVSRWRNIDPSLARALQRRSIAVLSVAVAFEKSKEARAEVAASVERLLRERALGEDGTIVTEARNLISAAMGNSTS